MSEKLIRVYKTLDIKNIQQHMMIYGDTSGRCSKCHELDLKLSVKKCPKCGTEFKYISFQNVKVHMPKIQKLALENPNIDLVDYDDFKRLSGALKAEEFLK